RHDSSVAASIFGSSAGTASPPSGASPSKSTSEYCCGAMPPRVEMYCTGGLLRSGSAVVSIVAGSSGCRGRCDVERLRSAVRRYSGPQPARQERQHGRAVLETRVVWRQRDLRRAEAPEPVEEEHP